MCQRNANYWWLRRQVAYTKTIRLAKYQRGIKSAYTNRENNMNKRQLHE